MMEQAPRGKRANATLARPPIPIFGNSRDEAAAAIVPQYPRVCRRSHEPRRTSAAGNGSEFAARLPKFRIEQRFRSAELCIAKALGISQHDARCSGNALAALYHSYDYLKLQTAAATRMPAASLGNRRYLPCVGGAPSLPSGVA